MTAAATFAFPTTILFGAGSVSELRERMAILGIRRPLVVTDRGLMATGAFRAATGAIGADVPVFSDTHSNPTEDDVSGAIRAYRDGACDGVIGLGGGSSIDVAKIIRLRI